MKQRPAIALVLVAAAPLVFMLACKTERAPTPDPIPDASASQSVVLSATPSVTASESASTSLAASTSADAGTVVDCARSFKSMQVGAEAALQKFSSCTTDADCVTVPGRVCFGSCDTAINKAGVAAHQNAIRAAQPLCDQFKKGPCLRSFPVATPTCPMVVAACVGGVCKGTWR